MVEAHVKFDGFDRGISGLIYQVGLNAQTVVAKESGELIKTLVRVSPKAAPQKIRSDIERKFAWAGDSNNSRTDRHGTVGASGIDWYFADSDFLRGVAPELDKRNASVDELKALLYTLKPFGKRMLQFTHPRKHQRVLLYQTVLTKASTVRKLAAAKAKNRGRLAAAWLVATVMGPIRLSGTGLPPDYVMRHVTGAKGDFINGLGDAKFPKFTIINYAKGIGQRTVNNLVRRALEMRAKAMATNALLFMTGKKKLSDYAR